MAKMVMVTVCIRRVYGGERVKDRDVDEAHENNEEEYCFGNQ